ncbi:MAG: hypothetical protein GPI99_19680 [Microcystis aeruginosa W13-15]|nr:hypothetical protein [Microcystis aeruginosa W13-15]
MLFSKRKGYSKISDIIQKDSLKLTSKNKIWSFLCFYLWDKIHVENSRYADQIYLFDQYYTEQTYFFKKIWIHYFEYAVDTIPREWVKMYNAIRTNFFDSEWHITYSLLEFILRNWKDEKLVIDLSETLNGLFESELIPYRILDKTITDLTSEEEISELNSIYKLKSNPVKEHISLAINKLYNREKPDYRNSIKESISAVEACCRDILQDDKPTLGKALSAIERKIEIHGSLKSAFDKLYGYTSDSTGIRHSLLDKDKITFEEAKFMLVACSAFINYLYGINSKK